MSRGTEVSRVSVHDGVSAALFGNAGTGSFILVPDIAPLEY